MSPHKKCYIFFLRQDFSLKIFVAKLRTSSIHFWQKLQRWSSAQKSWAQNVPHGGEIKKFTTFPTQFNKKIVRPPKKVRKNEKYQKHFFEKSNFCLEYVYPRANSNSKKQKNESTESSTSDFATGSSHNNTVRTHVYLQGVPARRGETTGANPNQNRRVSQGS